MISASPVLRLRTDRACSTAPARILIPVKSSPPLPKTAPRTTPKGAALNIAPQSVPLLDLRRQYEGIREDVLAAIARVCDSQSFILGPEVEALEREIAALTGAAGAVGCASGTEALWLALVAAGVKPGDSVITTAFSFFASASAIVRAGATPVFVDVDSGTLNLDPALVAQPLRDRRLRDRRLRKKGPENLRAILPVHLYGQCADMDAFDRNRSGIRSCDCRGRRPGHRRRVERARCGRARGNGCLQFLSHQEPERLRRRGHRHHDSSGNGRAHAATPQSWQSAALLPRRIWLERTHGRHSGGGAAREAGSHRRLEPAPPTARRNLRPVVCRRRADVQPGF